MHNSHKILFADMEEAHIEQQKES